ncbi:sulfite exporter TauE/SafE family protein [Vibrio sp. SS-MA-C1-2]|uniref:sulfite exporter TauE/SafE family protein n=1 Tax=Vibrio sp. SS-MA-C1-2 TaxID=2908646 RepID=UPI001F2D4598|nr:sulfite exporter TauE/SafE family protein [Vibrio sp. SS-MA-C1-2]UJF16952.1 sulfite exporter TauE/SafE family protein [Vibrio sp. SS-MA-C1-2]
MTFILIFITVLISATIQGSTGMGFALIMAPVLIYAQPELMPFTLLLLMIPLNAYILIRELSSLNKPSLKWIFPSRFIGTFLGIFILVILTPEALKVFVGASTVFAVGLSFIAPKFSPNNKAYFCAGLVTGITETSTGVGGPPLALVYQYEKASVMRASIAACFLFGEIISIVILIVMGSSSIILNQDISFYFLSVFLGLYLSNYIKRYINDKTLRMFVLVFSLVSGLMLVFF